tara:strand:+ start:369 stop:944 length:576 start_codon:yes stop_codon:yes gene_type:complete
MNSKILVQLIILLFFLSTIFFVYRKYFSPKKDSVVLIDKNQDLENLGTGGNLIKDIRYLYTDKNRNRYLITSKYGEVSNKNIDIILMKNVEAEIKFFKKDTVYIDAESAKYNSQNFDTEFSQNVVLKYTNHEINAENIDLSFQKNFALLYNSVVYKNSYNELFADKIEIDLITKNSKIFMNNNKKIKIIGK